MANHCNLLWHDIKKDPRYLKSLQREGRDSNPRWTEAHNGFRDRPIQPLWHLPKCKVRQDGILPYERARLYRTRSQIALFKRRKAQFVTVGIVCPKFQYSNAIQDNRLPVCCFPLISRSGSWLASLRHAPGKPSSQSL